jgi:hypothetical protein
VEKDVSTIFRYITVRAILIDFVGIPCCPLTCGQRPSNQTLAEDLNVRRQGLVFPGLIEDVHCTCRYAPGSVRW